MKRSYNMTKTTRKEQEIRVSPEKKRFFEDNKPNNMTLKEYNKIFNLRKHNIKRFAIYHDLSEKDLEELLKELEKALPGDLTNYSVSKSYKTIQTRQERSVVSFDPTGSILVS